MATTVITVNPLWYHFKCDLCPKVINSASYECRDKHMLEKHSIDFHYEIPEYEKGLREWYRRKGIDV